MARRESRQAAVVTLVSNQHISIRTIHDRSLDIPASDIREFSMVPYGALAGRGRILLTLRSGEQYCVAGERSSGLELENMLPHLGIHRRD